MKRLLLTITVFFLFCSMCFGGANTGVNYATAIGYSEDDWANPNAAFICDETYATATTSGQISYFGEFGFHLPYRAIITGVEVILTLGKTSHCNVSKPGLSTVYITGDNYVTVGSKTVGASTPVSIKTLGASNDRWNKVSMIMGEFLTLTPSGFNNDLFSVGISANLAGTWSCESGYSEELWLDCVGAKVYYKMPESPYIAKLREIFNVPQDFMRKIYMAESTGHLVKMR